MALYVWPQELAPEYPLAVLEHEVDGDRDRMHWHDYFEVALVLDGHGTFTFGRRSLTAEPGDVFFIDDSHPHAAVAAPGSPLRLLLVLFRPELIAGPGCRALDLAYLAPFRASDGSASARLAASVAAPEVASAIQRLAEVWTGPGPRDLALADATLRLALAHAARAGECGPADADDAGCTADRREQLRPVLAYLEGHCRDSVTLATLAGLVHVSPSRVRHLFKDATGVGFKDYLTQVRVAEAKRLLLTTELSVADVARSVSYTNLHQFYRVFHRSCAMSPGEYRRHYAPAGIATSQPEPAIAGGVG